MEFIYSVIGFLLAIGILVAVHEFGHYWVAKKLGVKVLKYSVGFGKPLFSKIAGKDKTEYVLAAIPLGGYVKMLDESECEVDPSEVHRAFNRQPIWKRSLIVAAGPGINFLFAIVAFFALGLMPAESIKPTLGELPVDSLIVRVGAQSGNQLLSVDGKGYHYFGEHDLYIFNQVLRGQDIAFELLTSEGEYKAINVPVAGLPIYNISPQFIVRTIGLMPKMPPVTTSLDRVLEGSVAAKAGLQVGDEIIIIAGQKISEWSELVEKISQSPSQEISVTYLRDGIQHSVYVTPDAVNANGILVGRLGIAPVVKDYLASDKQAINRTVWQSLNYGVEQTWLMSSVTLRMLWKMLTLEVSHENISGPITIAQVTGQAIQVGLDYYLHILAVISISLGIMNLLPIPMLDGGHLFMYLIETVAGKTIAEKTFAVGQRFGILFLAGLMSLAFYNDIFRLMN